MTHPYGLDNPYPNGNEDLRDAWDRGCNSGHGIACHNVPTMGERAYTESDGWAVVDADNVREIHATVCFEAEGNSRQYSPFEFMAVEFDDSENPEAMWEAYNEGVQHAIFKDLEGYTDEDYGIGE